MIPGQIIRD
jgi:hypothetical protein